MEQAKTEQVHFAHRLKFDRDTAASVAERDGAEVGDLQSQCTSTSRDLTNETQISARSPPPGRLDLLLRVW
jgi:hypothetical protein